MRYLKSISLYFSIFTFVFIFKNSYGQAEQQDSTSAIADTMKVSYFTVTGNYVSNLVFFGRSGAHKTPSISTDLYYKTSKGLWFSGSLINTLESNQLIDMIGASVGLDTVIGKRLYLSTSYNRFFYPSNNLNIQTAASNLADLYIGLDNRFVYPSIGAAYIFSSVSKDLFVTLSVSRYLEKANIFNSIVTVSIEPKILLNAGTQNFAQEYQEELFNLTDFTTPDPTMTARPGQGGGPMSPGAPSQPTTTDPGTTNNEEASSFNVLSYEFNFPLGFTIGNFYLETNYSYVIPVNLLNDDNSKAQSIYSLKLFYTFKYLRKK